jgi:hypothetical protein
MESIKENSGIVHIPNTEISYYMNPRLKRNLDTKIIPSLTSKDKDCVLVIDGGEGCQPKGSKVLMSNGIWKNIEDIKIGDELISPQKDGSNVYSKVINLFKFRSKNIYDIYEKNRDKKKLYSCSENHWIPMNIKIGKKKREWIIRNFMAGDLAKKNERFFINSTTPTMNLIEKFKDRKNCEIEPYTLGAWLGDGHFSSNNKLKENIKFGKETIVKGHWRNFKSGKVIWQTQHKAKTEKKEYLKNFHRDIGITCNDLSIIEEVSKYYPIMHITNKKDTSAKVYKFSMNGDFAKGLIKYGLEGKGSGDKFIPECALMSDANYRKRLLAGMIDTDGYLSRQNSYSIVTKSKQLSKDIEFLICSLGGRCSIKKVKKSIKKLGFIGEYYNISFYLGDIDLPVTLERKKRDKNFFYLSANRKSIRLEKRKSELVYGFELDSESHFYITDNYVITRNSGKSTLGFQIGKYVDPTLNLSRVVFDGESFRQAIFKAKKGQCVIYDEAFTGLSSRSSLSSINTALVSLMMQMRQKNLFIILILPTFFLLDKYAALFRTMALVHVYENKGTRGYFRLYNRAKKKYLYLYGKKDYSYLAKSGKNQFIKTKFKGRFYGKFALGNDEEEEKYRKKKSKALEDTQKNPMSAGQLKYKDQRDKILFLLRKTTKKTYQEIEEMLLDYDVDISYVQIRNICNKFGDSERLELKKELLEEKRKKQDLSDIEFEKQLTVLQDESEKQNEERDEEYEKNLRILEEENQEEDFEEEDFEDKFLGENID